MSNKAFFAKFFALPVSSIFFIRYMRYLHLDFVGKGEKRAVLLVFYSLIEGGHLGLKSQQKRAPAIQRRMGAEFFRVDIWDEPAFMSAGAEKKYVRRPNPAPPPAPTPPHSHRKQNTNYQIHNNYHKINTITN